MLFFRSKNAKILTMIAAIVLVVVIAYFNLVSSKDKHNKQEEEVKTPTAAQQLIDKDLKNNYPASVREVVKLACNITKEYYEEELSQDDLVKLSDQHRMLFDDELLEENIYSEYIERLQNEIEKYEKAQTKISGFDIVENKEIKYWYNNDKKCASIQVAFKVTGKEPGVVYEKFILRQDSNEKWKILGWEPDDGKVTNDYDKISNDSKTDSKKESDKESNK